MKGRNGPVPIYLILPYVCLTTRGGHLNVTRWMYTELWQWLAVDCTGDCCGLCGGVMWASTVTRGSGVWGAGGRVGVGGAVWTGLPNVSFQNPCNVYGRSLCNGDCHPQVAADRALLRGLQRQAAQADVAAQQDGIVADLLALSVAQQVMPGVPLPDVLAVWRAVVQTNPTAPQPVCPPPSPLLPRSLEVKHKRVQRLFCLRSHFSRLLSLFSRFRFRSMLSGLRSRSMLSCLRFHSLLSCLRYHSLLSCLCFHSLFSRLRSRSLLSCLCFHSLLSRLRYHSLFSRLRFSSLFSRLRFHFLLARFRSLFSCFPFCI
eukprot:jgi/Botrbrau1/12694/Bobra.67_1s0058.1